MTKKVFLSYSSRDSATATWLAEALQANGIAVWYAEWEVRIGDSIIQAINDGIESSDYLVVLLSKASVTSKWVQEEMAAAIYRTIQKGGFILPILLERCSLPPLLQHRRTLNFAADRDAALRELVACVSGSSDIPDTHSSPASTTELIRAYRVRRISPLAYAVTKDGSEIAMAKCTTADNHLGTSQLTGFATRACVLSCDLASLQEDEWLRVDEVVVTVDHYSEPPGIVDIIEPLPAMRAHVCYVEIDSPSRGNKRTFSSSLFNHSFLGYLVIEHGKPERLYVMIGALTPGVYDFRVGVSVSYKDLSQLCWLTNQTIFVPR